MAFINCPKCNAQIAELTKVCPACHTVITANSAILSPAATQPPLPPNPFYETFLGMLVEPRVVFGNIIKRGNGIYTWPMLWTTSATGFLAGLVTGEKLLVSLIAVPLTVGILWLILWVGAWVHYHVGRWFGGKGTLADLYDFVVWGLEVSCFTDLVKFFRHLIMAGGAWESIWRVIGWGVDIWGMVFGILLLSTAHRYSWIRAVGTGFVIATPILILVTFLMRYVGMTWMDALMQ